MVLEMEDSPSLQHSPRDSDSIVIYPTEPKEFSETLQQEITSQNPSTRHPKFLFVSTAILQEFLPKENTTLLREVIGSGQVFHPEILYLTIYTSKFLMHLLRIPLGNQGILLKQTTRMTDSKTVLREKFDFVRDGQIGPELWHRYRKSARGV